MEEQERTTKRLKILFGGLVTAFTFAVAVFFFTNDASEDANGAEQTPAEPQNEVNVAVEDEPVPEEEEATEKTPEEEVTRAEDPVSKEDETEAVEIAEAFAPLLFEFDGDDRLKNIDEIQSYTEEQFGLMLQTEMEQARPTAENFYREVQNIDVKDPYYEKSEDLLVVEVAVEGMMYDAEHEPTSESEEYYMIRFMLEDGKLKIADYIQKSDRT